MTCFIIISDLYCITFGLLDSSNWLWEWWVVLRTQHVCVWTLNLDCCLEIDLERVGNLTTNLGMQIKVSLQQASEEHLCNTTSVTIAHHRITCLCAYDFVFVHAYICLIKVLKGLELMRFIFLHVTWKTNHFQK